MDDIKILLIGPGGVGKTTIRKVFFDQESPYALIQETLEPTIGVETSLYNLGSTIAIHDLAGQQMDYWIQQADENFQGTDMIISLFDCRTPWGKIVKNIKNIEEIHSDLCPSAEHLVLIHKIDTISEEDRKVLAQKISDKYPQNIKFTIFLSSISQEFFMETFSKFSRILKRVLFKVDSFDFSIQMLKADLLKEFIRNESYDFSELMEKLKITENELTYLLHELNKKNILIMDETNKAVSLSEYGITFIKNISDNIHMKINEAIAPQNNYIKALILAENHGRVFFTYQINPLFFQEKFPENKNDDETVSTLISMFFTAIYDFGQSLDQKGILNIRIAGEDVDIYFFGYQSIFGIFFINRIKNEEGIIKILKQVIRETYHEAFDKIDDFIKTGKISDQFEDYSQTIINKLRTANENIKVIDQVESQISQDSLFKLYENITMKNFEEIDVELLKSIIFKHILDESSFIIDQIYEQKE